MRPDTNIVINLVLAMFATIASGASVYTFSLFAPALRQAPFNYSEADISSIAAWSVFATFLNMPAGAIFDWKGPRLTLVFACLVMTLSWVLLYSYVLTDDIIPPSQQLQQQHTTSSNSQQQSSPPSKFVVTLLFALPPFAGSFIEIGCVMGLLSIVRLQQQFVVILTKTVLGLGSTIVAVIFAAFFAPELAAGTSTLSPYGKFAQMLAVYSFITVALLAFWIGWGDKRCAGLTAPPATAGRLFKRMMARGEYLLVVGIVVLTVGNLLAVWSGSTSTSAGITDPSKMSWLHKISDVLHVTVAIVGILFPFCFFSLVQALPTECPTVPSTSAPGDSGDDKSEEMKQNQQQQQQQQPPPSPSSSATATAVPVQTPTALEGAKRRLAAYQRAEEEAPRILSEREERLSSNRRGGGTSPQPTPRQQQQQEQQHVEAAASQQQVQQQANTSDSAAPAHASSTTTTSDATRPEAIEEEGALPNLSAFAAGDNGRVFPEPQHDITELHDADHHHDHPGDAGGEENSSSSACTAPNRDSVLVNIRKPELWYLWFFCFAVWGSTSMIYSNAASIYRALPGSDGKEPFRTSINAIFVALLGVGNALGRMCAGNAVPMLQARARPSLKELLLLPPVMAALGASLLLVSEGTGLALPFFVVGAAVGLNWGSLIMIVRRLFHFPGQHYAFLYLAGSITPFVFTMLLFKKVYAAYETTTADSAASGGDDINVTLLATALHPGQPSCYGHKCIAVSMWVAIVLNILAFCVALRLNVRIEQGCFCSITNSHRVHETLQDQQVEAFFVPARRNRNSSNSNTTSLPPLFYLSPRPGTAGVPPQWLQEYINWMRFVEAETAAKQQRQPQTQHLQQQQIRNVD